MAAQPVAPLGKSAHLGAHKTDHKMASRPPGWSRQPLLGANWRSALWNAKGPGVPSDHTANIAISA